MPDCSCAVGESQRRACCHTGNIPCAAGSSSSYPAPWLGHASTFHAPACSSSLCQPLQDVPAGFTQRASRAESGTESSAHTGQGQRGLIATPLRNHLALSERSFPTRGGERGKNTSTALRNRLLLNRVAPGTLLQREQGSCRGAVFQRGRL